MWLNLFRRRPATLDHPDAAHARGTLANVPLEAWPEDALRTLLTSLEWDIEEMRSPEPLPRCVDMPPPA